MTLHSLKFAAACQGLPPWGGTAHTADAATYRTSRLPGLAAGLLFLSRSSVVPLSLLVKGGSFNLSEWASDNTFARGRFGALNRSVLDCRQDLV